MAFNIRKQKFSSGDRVVLVRPLYISDLDCDESIVKPSGEQLLAAGFGGIFMDTGYADGTVRIKFDSVLSDCWVQKIGNQPYRKDGNWSINSDLVRSAIRPTFEDGKEYMVAFDQEYSWNSDIKGGSLVKMVRSLIDEDGDVKVWFSSPLNGINYRYVRWYTLFPAEYTPKPLWGVYPYGKDYSFETDEMPLVVFVRDVVRSELGRDGKIEPVSPINPVMAHAGQIGTVDFMALDKVDRKNPICVTFLDHSRTTPAKDYWQLPADCVTLLLSYDAAKPMTPDAFSVDNCCDDEDDDALWDVGDKVAVLLDTYETKWDDDDDKLVIDLDRINHSFRDGDEVYILSVDTDEVDEEDGLVYQIGHSNNGSGDSLWVRGCDLISIE